MSNAPPNLTHDPAWRAPDWVLIIRATWAIPALMREAAAEVMRRGLELSADKTRHQQMLDAALVAEDDRVAA